MKCLLQLSINPLACISQQTAPVLMGNSVQPGAPQQKRAMFGGLGGTSRPYSEVQVDDSEMNGDRDHYMETEENQQFRQEFEQRKAAQDEDLDFIEKGLGNLQNIAQDMGAELNKQDVLIDEIDKGVRRSPHCCMHVSMWPLNDVCSVLDRSFLCCAGDTVCVAAGQGDQICGNQQSEAGRSADQSPVSTQLLYRYHFDRGSPCGCRIHLHLV